MRSDLIRLLLDIDCKDLVNGGVVYSKTIDCGGLLTHLDAAAPETPVESKLT
jgi:hypothetical protein